MCLLNGRPLPKSLCYEGVTNLAIVNTQELGAASSHVNVVRLALGALFIKELVHSRRFCVIIVFSRLNVAPSFRE